MLSVLPTADDDDDATTEGSERISETSIDGGDFLIVSLDKVTVHFKQEMCRAI